MFTLKTEALRKIKDQKVHEKNMNNTAADSFEEVSLPHFTRVSYDSSVKQRLS